MMPSSAPIHVDQRLTPVVLTEIERIMTGRGLKMGDVMAELRFPRPNASLGNALSQGSRIKQSMIAALEHRLAQQPQQ